MDGPICPETGARMRRAVRPITLTYKGESMSFDMPGWYCDQSEASIFTGEDLKLSDRVLNKLKVRNGGMLEPAEIRRIREKLDLTQTVAGEVIGGGPDAFQKYETGDLLPSEAICRALRWLDCDPQALRAMSERRLNGPPAAPSPLHGFVTIIANP